jgi:glycosyltransferase involved in cell wall biosynthesis
MSETAVFVVPLKSGAGMRVKILEAWCWAVPVVSTTIGAEGIGAVDGEQMLVADDEASLTDAVIRVLTDGSLARRLSENGRSLVEQAYNWRQVYAAWNQVYRR